MLSAGASFCAECGAKQNGNTAEASLPNGAQIFFRQGGSADGKKGAGSNSVGLEMILCLVMLFAGIIALISQSLTGFLIFLICAFILSPFSGVLFNSLPEKWRRLWVRIAIVAVIVVLMGLAAINRDMEASAAQGEMYFWGIMDWIF